MSRSSRAGLAALAAAVTLTAVAGVVAPAAATTAPDLTSARDRAGALRADLAGLRDQAAASVAAYEQAEDALAEAVSASLGLAAQVDEARAKRAGAQELASRHAVTLFASGGRRSLLATLARSGSAQEYVQRQADLQAILAYDNRTRDAALEAGAVLEQAEREAAAAATERIALAGRLQEGTARLEALFAAQTRALETADAEVLRLVEEQRAAARAVAAEALRVAAAEQARVAALGAAPVSGGGPAFSGPAGTCPVGPAHSFTDTWHAPRSGGRLHQGTDVFAPKGSPAYAVVDGTIDKVGDGGLGGVTFWLRADNGDRFYYAHHDARDVSVGQRVSAGDVLGTVGNTGNAETTPSHIHFEAHPGGGGAVNPYPWLAAVCAG